MNNYSKRLAAGLFVAGILTFMFVTVFSPTDKNYQNIFSVEESTSNLEIYLFAKDKLRQNAPNARFTYADWTKPCENISDSHGNIFFLFAKVHQFIISSKTVGGYVDFDSEKSELIIASSNLTKASPSIEDINFPEAFSLYSDTIPQIEALISPYQQVYPNCILRVSVNPQRIQFTINKDRDSLHSIYTFYIDRNTDLIFE